MFNQEIYIDILLPPPQQRIILDFFTSISGRSFWNFKRINSIVLLAVCCLAFLYCSDILILCLAAYCSH